MSLAVEWITDAEGFTALGDEWGDVLPEDAHPFDLHCWHQAWWEAFGGSSELAVCTARRDGKLAGVFPLSAEGSRLKALSNDHSNMFRPLAIDQEAMETLAAVALERAGSGFELQGLPEGDPSVAWLRAGARTASMVPLIESTFSSPFVDTHGDFEQWRKENKRRWKAPLERLHRKMRRDYNAEFTFIEPPRDFEPELDPIGYAKYQYQANVRPRLKRAYRRLRPRQA